MPENDNTPHKIDVWICMFVDDHEVREVELFTSIKAAGEFRDTIRDSGNYGYHASNGLHYVIIYKREILIRRL